MKSRLRYLITYFIVTLAVFALAKPLFMCFNGAAERGIGISDYLDVMWHGLSLDAATTGYLIALPWLLVLLSVWIRIPALRRILLFWWGITGILISLILVADTCLYTFWDFKLDATVFTYLDSPRDAMASVSTGYLLTALLVITLLAVGLYQLGRLLPVRQFLPPATLARRWTATAVLLLFGGFTFLCIRGGTGKSTANIGMVYYSNVPFLNHAAVNPAFNLLYSMQKTEDFGKQCDYYSEPVRAQLFDALQYDTTTVTADTLLRITRPNVLIILMEGFGASFIDGLGGPAHIAPEFNRLSREGVFFTQCYANSYRTDRGTVSALSGHPAYPHTSIMKLPQKSRTLPAIAATLKRAGYATDFLYGGDINFTNMQSYLRATGYDQVTGDTHFTAEERRTHAWGVTDSILFNYLYDELRKREDSSTPWHTTFLTLASHEPWTVPYNRIPNDEKANAMAYLDHCLGRFVERLRHTPLWDDLLVICVPDHNISYPSGLTPTDKQRCHIPMLWLGGAISSPQRIDRICNQSDMAATLLGQMGLPHGDFLFSRDVTSHSYRYPSAAYACGNEVGFIDSTGYTVLDIGTNRILTDTPVPSSRRDSLSRAYLQTIHDDLGAR